MKAYVAFSYYDMDKGISSYTIFMPTPTGIKIDNIDIHDDWSGEEETITDLDKIKILLSRKYKMNISIRKLKPEYHVIW